MNLSNKLSEFLGIIAGDGSLSVYNKGYDYKVQISGNKTEDLPYFDHLRKMAYNLFKIEPKIKIREDEIRLTINRKHVLEELEKHGLKRGKKARTIRIPRKVKEKKNYSIYFLRGLFDTDGCITFKKEKLDYPVIEFRCASKNLIKDISIILKKLKISYCTYNSIRNTPFGEFQVYGLDINGKGNLRKWIDMIGSNNPRHLTKIAVWSKLGYCPRNTTIKERQVILNNKL